MTVPPGPSLTATRRAGSTNASRGYWEITDEGRALLRQHPDAIPSEVFTDLLNRVREERKERKAESEGRSASEVSPAVLAEPDGDQLSPVEQIQAAYARLRDDLGTILLSNLRAAEPAFLEKAVIELLGAMGYGADDDALEVTGGSGNGGIDGIVRLDRRGLEHIYVQAKRHEASNKVQGKDIQAFYGALMDRNATKGLFITTAYFASGAREFTQRREGIVLVNGDQLAQLMIDYGIGVERDETVEIVRVNDAFFEAG